MEEFEKAKMSEENDNKKYTAYIKRAYCLNTDIDTLVELIAEYGCFVCPYWNDISCYCNYRESNLCPYGLGIIN